MHIINIGLARELTLARALVAQELSVPKRLGRITLFYTMKSEIFVVKLK